MENSHRIKKYLQSQQLMQLSEYPRVILKAGGMGFKYMCRKWQKDK